MYHPAGRYVADAFVRRLRVLWFCVGTLAGALLVHVVNYWRS